MAKHARAVSRHARSRRQLTAVSAHTARTLVRRAAVGAGTLTCAAVVISGFGATTASAATLGDAAVAEAAQFAGVPYVYGGSSPSGFDCSGYVQYVYRHVGVSLPRTADEQYHAVAHISHSSAEPGDLIFFTDGGYAYHVAIYAGDGTIWDAAHTGTRITRRSIWTSDYVVGRVGGATSEVRTAASSHAAVLASYHPAAHVDTMLEIGSRGSAVVDLQRRLGITADGIFGPQTRGAVEAFQRAHGLEVDGIVGPITGAALHVTVI